MLSQVVRSQEPLGGISGGKDKGNVVDTHPRM